MSDFHLLLQEQIPSLLRYATALTRDSEQAADLVEDTVREALDYQRHCRGDVRIWLFTLLHDLRGNPFREMTLPAPAPLDPRLLLTLSDLDRAMGQLTEQHRAVLLLIGLEGLNYAEAAAALRITVATLRTRLSKARAALRRLMGVADTTRTTARRAAA
ncbi:MAG TPA: sigma factor-like helix-turn-helix DNA-binding protein [Stellaceae bacterium]|nr:sigma factor-like helix-turn-helix DNA-binding protein [Stellaceae bacterium]